MGTLTVKSSTIQSAADYENKDVNIAMSLNYNTSAGVISLISISGSVTDTTNGKYLGNLNGNAVDGEMQYNFSGIKNLRKLGDIATCLDDIQEQIESPKDEL